MKKLVSHILILGAIVLGSSVATGAAQGTVHATASKSEVCPGPPLVADLYSYHHLDVAVMPKEIWMDDQPAVYAPHKAKLYVAPHVTQILCQLARNSC